MSEILREGPIRKWLKERETLIPRKKIFGGSYSVSKAMSSPEHKEIPRKVSLPPKEKISIIIRPRLEDAAKTKIPIHFGYSYDRGELSIDREKYAVGQVSITGFGDTVKEEVEKVFGELRYTVGGFREETFENEKVRVDYYASFGYLSVTVRPK